MFGFQLAINNAYIAAKTSRFYYSFIPFALNSLYVVVVVVVIAHQVVSYRQLSMLRKSATAAGLSHRSCTVSCIRWL